MHENLYKSNRSYDELRTKTNMKAIETMVNYARKTYMKAIETMVNMHENICESNRKLW